MGSFLKSWTIGGATRAGLAAGLLALILWPIYAAFQKPVRLPFAAALAITAFCGLSILTITAADLLFHRTRGDRLRAVRTFDIALALLMAIPSLLTLRAIL